MELTVKTPQLAAAFRIAERSGATEVTLTEMDVGAGRPAWLRMGFVTDGGDRRAIRVSKGGNTERMQPDDAALPPSDPDRDLPPTINCPLDGTALTPAEPGSEAEMLVCVHGHRMARGSAMEEFRKGVATDSDRDLANDRKEEADWERSAREEEQR